MYYPANKPFLLRYLFIVAGCLTIFGLIIFLGQIINDFFGLADQIEVLPYMLLFYAIFFPLFKYQPSLLATSFTINLQEIQTHSVFKNRTLTTTLKNQDVSVFIKSYFLNFLLVKNSDSRIFFMPAIIYKDKKNKFYFKLVLNPLNRKLVLEEPN